MVPSISAPPSLSPAPTPLPTIPAEASQINVTSYAELKTAVENAPACGEERVQITIAADAITMMTNESAITIPVSSCVGIFGGAAFSEIIGNGHDRLFFGEEFVRGFELSGLILANGFAADGSGGAVSFADGCGDLVLVGTLFIDNGALDDGGALHVQGGGTSSSSVRVERTRFDSNDCGANGGAVAASDGVALSMSNVTFANNTAVGYGGGLYGAYDISLDTYGANYYDNSAGVGGGGMACNYDSDARIRGGVARGNEAWATYDGGGAYNFLFGTTVEMDGVVAMGNFAAFAGGAVVIAYDCTATLRSVTALWNTAGGFGGGVFFYGPGASLRIAESRISHGVAGTYGGGVGINQAEQLVIKVSAMLRDVH